VTHPPGPSFNVSIPNAARMYNFWLGGKDHYEADRKAAGEVMERLPDVVGGCRDNREFLKRVVRYLTAEAGIRQFIDIGTGLPTMENVHEVAQGVAPESRIVYVDYDPIVVMHAQALLATSQTVTVVHGDICKPEDIFLAPELTKLINFSQPVAILLFAILHFIPDEEGPARIAAALKEAMAPGSYLAISHATGDEVSTDDSSAAREVYARASAPMVPRSRGDVSKFFDGLNLLDPGLVDINHWPTVQEATVPRPRALFYGGVAVKQN
jgi:hypothetical protein